MLPPQPAGPSDSRLEFHEVDATRWPDFVSLFEGRGGPKHCWCLVWRDPDVPREQLDRAARKAAMGRRVAAGTPIGLLGYLDGQPVAWCSVAPRETYRPLGGPEDGPTEHVWSIVCFFVQSRLRRQGITPALLRAAVAHASARGATVVEAYPVDPDSPSYRFMGFRAMFLAAGFVEVGRAGSRRHVMRLAVAE